MQFTQVSDVVQCGGTSAPRREEQCWEHVRGAQPQRDLRCHMGAARVHAGNEATSGCSQQVGNSTQGRRQLRRGCSISSARCTAAVVFRDRLGNPSRSVTPQRA